MVVRRNNHEDIEVFPCVCVCGWVGGCGEGYIGHVNTISFLAVLVLYLRSVGSKRG